MNPVTCAACGKGHGPLDKPGWKQFKKHAHKVKTLKCLVNNAELAQKFGQIVHKFGAWIPCNEKEEIVPDCKNGNAHWQDATFSKI